MGQVHRLEEHVESKRRATASSWRAGKPYEDPEKMKRWGRITAKPSEFLVVMRRGRVLKKKSGQGASHFKWPADSIAVVPTSLQRLSFTADQVTREKTGVAVTGLAVYRIVDPLLAFRVLNFAYPERAQQKLEETLTSMFIGATRRLVANLAVDECLQKRKAALADELIREVAPVVSGKGHPEDSASAGWGVVIDTIEIQEVRVLSDRVFSAMQAPYRRQLEQRAHEAEAESNREVALRTTQCELDVKNANVDAQLEIQRREAELAQSQADREKNQSLLELRNRTEIDRHEREATRRSAELELQAHELLTRAMSCRIERDAAEFAASAERREATARIEQLEAVVRNEDERAQAEVEAMRAHGEAEVLRAEKLPELAAAVGQRFGEVKITQIGQTDGSPFATIAQAVAAVAELAKS
ncbi:MAG: SPFH domain-containing protein [Myxococcota bacterium]